MIKRICSTLVLWTVLISVVYFFKAKGFSILMMVLALLAGYEACKLLKAAGAKPSFKVYTLATLGLFLPMVFISWWPDGYFILSYLIIAVMFAVWVLRDPYSDFPVKTVISTFLTFMCISGMLLLYSALSFAFNSPYCGVLLAILIIAAAKFSDVGGYLFGMLLGRHKMSPTISPKKTWEGAFGGIVLSSAISAAIVYFSGEVLSGVITPLQAAVVALPIAVFAICSDLLESVLKRRANIKDSGNTIPGIGGALDLADSMLLPAPFAIILVAICA